MKIVVVSSCVFPLTPPNGTVGYAGLEVIAYHTAKGLAERGHQVALAAPSGSWCPGVEMVDMGPAGVPEEIAYGGNAKDTNRQFVWNGYWPALLNAECVIDHSWMKFCYMLKAEGRLKAPILGVCHAPVNTMMQRLPPVEKPSFVCISQDQAEHFYNLFGRRAKVAYNGADVNFYRPLGLPRLDRFLFLARFSSIKGPDLAIRACLDAGVGLDMVGDTTITNEPQLLAECQRLASQGKPGQIRIIGNQPRGSCVWWFSQAHAFIHSAKTFREPYGLSPVEAQLCGLPVLCFDNGALRETVGPGCGWIVQEEAELVKAIHEAKTNVTDEVRQRCRTWAERFSLENMVTSYERLCREAVATGGW